MSSAEPAIISANSGENNDYSQAASSFVLPILAPAGETNLQTVKGVKISRKPETFSSLISYLEACGLKLLYIIYERTSFSTDNIYFIICESIYGDHVAILLPDNFKLKSGDISVKKEYDSIKYAPDGITNYYLDKIESSLSVGLLFVCNAGMQYFPPKEKESHSYAYDDYDEASLHFDLQKHYYEVMPVVEFSRLVLVDRLNTLHVALEEISSNPGYEQVYQDFSKAILSSPLMPLMSSEAEFTLLVPPSLPEGADLITLASHIILGRYQFQREEDETLTTKSYTQSGQKVEIVYEGGFLSKIVIDEETEIEIDEDRTSVSKYNGIIIGIKEAMPRFEPEEELKIVETSDLDDLFTIFDLAKISLNIGIAKKKLDVEDQNELFKTVNNLNLLTEEIILATHRKMKDNFNLYVKEMSEVQRKFYSKEVPCVEPVCEDYEESMERTKKANKEFRKHLGVGGKLRFILKEVELLMLELFKIQQEMEVENPITELQNMD